MRGEIPDTDINHALLKRWKRRQVELEEEHPFLNNLSGTQIINIMHDPLHNPYAFWIGPDWKASSVNNTYTLDRFKGGGAR